MTALSAIPGHIKPLTGLRGFAALWVFFLHATFGKINDFDYFPAFDRKIDWGSLTPLIMEGHYAVDVFFILSGFVLSYVYAENFRHTLTFGNIRNFYIKRLARIYPAHLFITVVLALLFITNIWNPERSIDLKQFLLSISLTNVWRNPSLNMPAWSVSAEMFAYILCPFLLFGIVRIKNIWAQLFMVVALSVLYPLIFVKILCCDWHFGSAAILRVFAGFTIGCFLYGLHKDGRLLLRGKNIADILCLLSWIILFVLMSIGASPILIYPVLPLLVFTQANAKTFVADFFGNRVAVYLGLISYSMYLVHYPVLEFYTWVFSDYLNALPQTTGQIPFIAILALMTVTLIGASALCYHWVEEPCRRWITKRWKENGAG